MVDGLVMAAGITAGVAVFLGFGWWQDRRERLAYEALLSAADLDLTRSTAV